MNANAVVFDFYQEVVLALLGVFAGKRAISIVDSLAYYFDVPFSSKLIGVLYKIK